MSAHHGVRWGFHSLSERAAERLVARAEIHERDLVLDLGAGDGAITAALVSTGAHVIAVELHPRRCAAIRERFRDDRVTVVRADLVDLRLPRRAFKVVANPPFATTTAVLRRLLSPGSHLEQAHLVVPWHVARRWTTPTAPGRGRWGAEFDVRIHRAPAPREFRPPPPHDVSLLWIRRRT